MGGDPARPGPLSVFSDLAQGCSTTLSAAETVLRRYRWWSVCELGLSQDTVNSIRTALGRLTATDVRQLLGNENLCAIAGALPARWRHSFRWSDLLVLPLLVSMGETLRSSYQGGPLYEYLAPQTGLDRYALEEVFVGGQPTAAFKTAMRSTAPRLQMRHHFGGDRREDGEHGKPWYRLLWLQSGPGRFHLLEQFSRIDHQGSVTAKSLAGLDGYGQRSDTFMQLLHELQRLRGFFSDPSESRRILARNPWIHPEWVDRLMDRATTRHIPLVDELTESAPFAEEHSEQPLIDFDRLISVEDGQVFAILNVTDEFANRCSGTDDVLLRLSGQPYAHLLRSDSGFIRDPHQLSRFSDLAENQIAAKPAQSLMFSAEDHQGQLLANIEVELWPPRAVVAAFDLDGHAISEIDELQPSVLAIREGLRLDPPGAAVSRADTAGWGIIQLALILSDPVRVFDGELLLWSWGDRHENIRTGHTVDLLSRGATHHPGHPPLLGGHVQLAIRPRNSRDVILAVRTHDGHLARFEAKPGPRVFSCRMLNDRVVEQFSVNVLLEGGGSPHVCRAGLSLHAVGAVLLGTRGRVRLGSESELDRTEGLASSIELGCDPTDAAAHGCWLIMEGDRYVSRVTESGGTFRPPILIGLGEPLVAKPGPFNPPAGAELILASSVTDHGAAAATLIEGEDGSFLHINTDRPLLANGTELLISLHYDGTRTFETPAAIEVVDSGQRWKTQAPADGCSPILARALTIGGERVGAVWSRNWDSCLDLPHSPPDVTTLVSWMLWFRLPILCNYARPIWARLAEEQLVPTLTALLQPSHLEIPEAGLTLDAPARGTSLVARLVLSIAGEAVYEHACEIIEILGNDPVAAVRQLSWIDPAAAVRTAMGFSYAHFSKTSALQQAELLIAAATNILSNAQFEHSLLRCSQALRRLQNSLDDKFMESVIEALARQAAGEKCTTSELHNIGLIINAAPDACGPITYGLYKRLLVRGR